MIVFACVGTVAAGAYKVRVVDRVLTGRPLVENAPLSNPYSKTACAGSPCTNVLNPAWLPTDDGAPGSTDGGLFIRLATPTCHLSVIVWLRALPKSSGLGFETPSDALVLKDGPPGEEHVALGMDPRAIYRPLTGIYYVFYQTGWNRTRRTQISSTRTPQYLSSWKRFKHTMFDKDDCGTTLWFPEDDDDRIAIEDKKAYAIVTFGTLRGGNLSLASSDDGMQTWKNMGNFLYTRRGHWDNATLSAGPPPMKLSDDNWLMLYNVDNKWPVQAPKPFPWFGRCALGWAILDKDNFTHILARAEEPLVYAEKPWELHGTTDRVVYSDGIRDEGNDTFTVFAGGADTVIEGIRIQVEVANGDYLVKPQKVYIDP